MAELTELDDFDFKEFEAMFALVPTIIPSVDNNFGIISEVDQNLITSVFGIIAMKKWFACMTSFKSKDIYNVGAVDFCSFYSQYGGIVTFYKYFFLLHPWTITLFCFLLLLVWR